MKDSEVTLSAEGLALVERLRDAEARPSRRRIKSVDSQGNVVRELELGELHSRLRKRARIEYQATNPYGCEVCGGAAERASRCKRHKRVHPLWEAAIALERHLQGFEDVCERHRQNNWGMNVKAMDRAAHDALNAARVFLRERLEHSEGVKKALRTSQRKLGRPRRLSPETREAVLALRARGLSWRAIARELHLPKSTVSACGLRIAGPKGSV